MKKIVFILAILFLSSCIDYTKGDSNVCPVHGKRMIKIIKPIIYGLSSGRYGGWDRYYSYYQTGGCVRKPYDFAIAYFCGKCRAEWIKGRDKSKKEFKKRHPDQKYH